MLFIDYPTSFGGNVLQRPAQVDGIQAKMGEWVCLVFHPTSSLSAELDQAARGVPSGATLRFHAVSISSGVVPGDCVCLTRSPVQLASVALSAMIIRIRIS